MKIEFLFILLAISILSCQSEPAEQAPTEETTAKPAKKTGTTAVGKMVSIEGSTLTLDNTETIELANAENADVVSIFLLRHAETMQGKTSLSGPGRARTGLLASLFSGKGLTQVYVDGNASMQTGLAAAKGSEDCGFDIVKFDGTDMFVKTILTNFKGKKVLVTFTAENLQVVLNQLAGEEKYSIPTNEYDNLFVVTARGYGDADITHVKY